MCQGQIRVMTPLARFRAQSLPSLESDRQKLRRADPAPRCSSSLVMTIV
jgi:hypothetical protein